LYQPLLNFGTKCWRVICFNLDNNLNRRLRGPWNQSGPCRNEINSRSNQKHGLVPPTCRADHSLHKVSCPDPLFNLRCGSFIRWCISLRSFNSWNLNW
jgi:hypothetical protein